MSKVALFVGVLVFGGCFRDLDSVQQSGAADTLAPSLSVHDASGAAWSTHDVPRHPSLTLTFPGPPPRFTAQQVTLLIGTPSEEVLADLQQGKPKQSTEALTIELDVRLDGQRAIAEPRSSLAPGAAYTLVWAPATQVHAFPVTVSRSPAAGAALLESLPSALDTRVPPNLPAVLLRFDGYLFGDASTAVQLQDEQAQPIVCKVTHEACQHFGLGDGDCLQVAPLEELNPHTRYQLALGPGLTDATGAALPPQTIAFETAAAPDHEAPHFLPLDCAKDELPRAGVCVLATDRSVEIRARSDEAALLSVTSQRGVTTSFGRALEYSVETTLTAPERLWLGLRDAAANRHQFSLELAPLADLAPLALSEVRPDPLGPEPDQEYVEIHNFGSEPTSIMGFTLTSDPYRDGLRIVTPLVLSPGEHVLLVGPTFDIDDPSDGPPPLGARIARLSGALSLKNDGAALYLRDAAGRRVSSAPALKPARPGRCLGRRADANPRSGASAAFSADDDCTPGFAAAEQALQ